MFCVLSIRHKSRCVCHMSPPTLQNRKTPLIDRAVLLLQVGQSASVPATLMKCLQWVQPMPSMRRAYPNEVIRHHDCHWLIYIRRKKSTLSPVCTINVPLVELRGGRGLSLTQWDLETELQAAWSLASQLAFTHLLSRSLLDSPVIPD